MDKNKYKLIGLGLVAGLLNGYLVLRRNHHRTFLVFYLS